MLGVDKEIGDAVSALSDADATKVAEILRNLEPTVAGAALSVHARSLAKQAKDAFDAQHPSLADSVNMGTAGVGLGLYVDDGGHVVKIAALNDVLIKQTGSNRDGRNDQQQQAEARRLEEEQGYRDYNAILRSVVAGAGYKIVAGGAVGRGAANDAGHEEILLRDYLKGVNAAPIRGAIPIGVSQNTICTRCV